MMLSGRPLLPTAADRRYLVERPEGDRLIRDLQAGMNTLVLAARGMGKTTFLRHVGARLEEDGDFTAVYLDGHRLTDAATILLAVRDALSGARTVVGDNLRAGAMAFTPMPVEVRNEQALASVRELGDAVGDQKVCVLLDDPDPEVAHRLFGRLRDDLWQTGIAWVVAGDEARRQQYLTPPADAFFERVMELAPLSQAQQRDLIRRRLDRGDDKAMLAVNVGSGSPRSLLAALREAASPDGVQATLERRAERQTRAADELGRLASMMLAEIEDGAVASASDPEWLKRFGISRQRAQQVLADLEREGLVSAERLPGPTGRPRKAYRRVDAPAGQ